MTEDRDLTVQEVGCLEAAFAAGGHEVEVSDRGTAIFRKPRRNVEPDKETVFRALELGHAVHRLLTGSPSAIFETLFERAAHRANFVETEGLFQILDDAHVDDDLLLEAVTRMGRRCLKRKCAMPDLKPGIEERLERARDAKKWTP